MKTSIRLMLTALAISGVTLAAAGTPAQPRAPQPTIQLALNP